VAGYVNSAFNTYANVYYLTGVAGLPDKANGTENNAGGSSIRATALSETDLKALPSALGIAFKVDTQSLNAGYPALAWQQPSGPVTGAPHSGDFNGDGVVTVSEVIQIARLVLGLENPASLTPAQFAVVDMNGDGVLVVNDVQLALRAALGL
jgi:hypothetical protein